MALPASAVSSVRLIQFVGALCWVLGSAVAAHAGEASGELVFSTNRGPLTVSLRHAYLVAGPDESGQPIRQLVLADKDLAAAISACAKLSCVSARLMNGATVDFDAGPRLKTWFVANDQLVQHSDTAKPETMSLQQDDAKGLAGRWSLSTGVGPRGAVQFNAPLLKAFDKY